MMKTRKLHLSLKQNLKNLCSKEKKRLKDENSKILFKFFKAFTSVVSNFV